MEIIKENHCYFVPRDFIAYVPEARDLKNNLEFYPEDAMTALQEMTSLRIVTSIVTESCWLASLYDMNEVHYWDYKEKEWKLPRQQTYGCSVNILTKMLLGFNSTIPQAVLSGVEGIIEFREKHGMYIPQSYKDLAKSKQ